MQNKFPRHRSQKIVVQHINDSLHNITKYGGVLPACYNVPTVEVVLQLTDSQDINVLDLELFLPIQRLQNWTSVTKIDKMVSKVEDVFHTKSYVSMNIVWQSLKRCFEGALKCKGRNEYRISLDSQREVSS